MAKAATKAPAKKVVKKAVKAADADEPKATKILKKAAKAEKKTAAPVEDIVPSVEKQEIITQYAVNDGDTGSPEVQIALLTRRIEKLVNHLHGNPHDNHSRRGLLGLVSKRRRLLNYLDKKDSKRVKAIKVKLGLT
jgi:small subunit ribosomal protein S15